MQNVHSILQLLLKGYSGRKIALELNLSRNTIKLYTDRFTSCAFSLEQLQQMDDAGLHAIAYADARQLQDDDRTSAFKQKIPYFLAELKRTGVTKYLLWLEYKTGNTEGYSYSQFCDLFAQYRKVLARSNEKAAWYLKLARLRLPAIPEHIECSAARNFTRQQLSTLLQGDYLKHGQNTLITGATGCGKSYLACALGHQACLQGYKTTYFNMNRLIEKITLAKLDGTYIRMLNHLEKQTLVILDDFGLQPLSQDVKLALLQIMEDRYAKKAVIITSQLPVSAWHQTSFSFSISSSLPLFKLDLL